MQKTFTKLNRHKTTKYYTMQTLTRELQSQNINQETCT